MTTSTGLARPAAFFADRYGLTEGRLDVLVGSAARGQVDYADVFVEHQVTEDLLLEDGVVKKASRTISQGAGVRAQAGVRTGYAYTDELAPEHLAAFGVVSARNSDEDQRYHTRHPCDIRATLHPVSDPEQASQEAKVLNLSLNGIGLLTDGPVPVGTLLSIELAPANEARTRTILSCVVHATARGEGEWALGCNFITELSEVDLRYFLQSTAK